MAVTTVAILSPGDMGHAVGRVLRAHGLNVMTCLDGRSERTRALARQAGIRDVATLEELVSQVDLVLSILVPAEASAVAQQVAEALRATGTDTYFADCNAVSPQTTGTMDALITGAGGRFIDGSIIGGPPRTDGGLAPRFYVSGPHASIMSDLHGLGIDVRQMGDSIGRASGIKMCYAALSKGTAALEIAVLAAAEAMGLSGELRSELMSSQPQAYQHMERNVPGLPVKAARWIGEMEEIATTFDHAGVTPRLHQGAADMFRLLAESPFADETPETFDASRTLEQTVAVIARSLTSLG